VTRIPPIDQANLIAGHAVACATAFLGGRHDAAQLADHADRIFLDLLVVETSETSRFLIPVQLLVITMMQIAKHARGSDETAVSEDRSHRWHKVMASLVELVCHESRQLKRD
jgi:hypothetical protein